MLERESHEPEVTKLAKLQLSSIDVVNWSSPNPHHPPPVPRSDHPPTHVDEDDDDDDSLAFPHDRSYLTSTLTKKGTSSAATMAVASEASANPADVLVELGQNKNVKTLLRVVILCLIAGAAVSSRLFSVIRTSPALRDSHRHRQGHPLLITYPPP